MNHTFHPLTSGQRNTGTKTGMGACPRAFTPSESIKQSAIESRLSWAGASANTLQSLSRASLWGDESLANRRGAGAAPLATPHRLVIAIENNVTSDAQRVLIALSQVSAVSAT